ncbi:MAG: hypothetical protein WCP57_00545 [Bacteroidota bacterium]
MKTKIFSVLLSTFILFLLVSCKKQVETYNAKLVNYTGLDGCSWMVKMNDGTIYEPLNLNAFEAYPSDNEPVQITFQLEPTISICMVGNTIRLQSLKNNLHSLIYLVFLCSNI